jgi:hypothetical protein
MREAGCGDEVMVSRVFAPFFFLVFWDLVLFLVFGGMGYGTVDGGWQMRDSPLAV